MVSSSTSALRSGLVSEFNSKLVDELLDAYSEAKSMFYLGGLRLSEVEGGRFCEAAFRLLQESCWRSFDPVGVKLRVEPLITKLGNLPAGSHTVSIRIHIPRALRVAYDIRNNRDAAHLADGIDPNLQDATLVISILDWVLAEFVRLSHNVSADEASAMVDNLVTRQVPVIQDFNGFLKVLRTDLSASAMCLVLLYQRGAIGASFVNITEWIKPSMRGHLRRTLTGLVDDKSWLHRHGETFFITRSGQREVEHRGWLTPV